MTFWRLVERVGHQVAECPAEHLVLRMVERLVAEKENQVFVQRPTNLFQRLWIAFA